MTKTFRVGDHVAWYFGPTKFEGDITRLHARKSGPTLIVLSSGGVEWMLDPKLTDIEIDPPTEIEPIGANR